MLQDDPANAGKVPWSIVDEAAYDDAQLSGLPAPPGAAAIMPATGTVAPSSAVVPRSLAGPRQRPASRLSSPPSSDSMLGLDHLSPTNGSMHGRTRQSVREDEVRAGLENENVQVLQENVHV